MRPVTARWRAPGDGKRCRRGPHRPAADSGQRPPERVGGAPSRVQLARPQGDGDDLPVAPIDLDRHLDRPGHGAHRDDRVVASRRMARMSASVGSTRCLTGRGSSWGGRWRRSRPRLGQRAGVPACEPRGNQRRGPASPTSSIAPDRARTPHQPPEDGSSCRWPDRIRSARPPARVEPEGQRVERAHGSVVDGIPMGRVSFPRRASAQVGVTVEALLPVGRPPGSRRIAREVADAGVRAMRGRSSAKRVRQIGDNAPRPRPRSRCQRARSIRRRCPGSDVERPRWRWYPAIWAF